MEKPISLWITCSTCDEHKFLLDFHFNILASSPLLFYQTMQSCKNFVLSISFAGFRMFSRTKFPCVEGRRGTNKFWLGEWDVPVSVRYRQCTVHTLQTSGGLLPTDSVESITCEDLGARDIRTSVRHWKICASTVDWFGEFWRRPEGPHVQYFQVADTVTIKDSWWWRLLNWCLARRLY